MPIVCPHCHGSIEISLPPVGDVRCPSCGSHFRLEPGPDSFETNRSGPTRIGRFEVLGTVGMGSFGTVYKARDSQLDRIVAVKVPRADTLDGEQHLDRFLREARSVAQLRHPHIVPIHEVGQQDGVPYLVSTFVEGATLEAYLTTRKPSFREAALLIATLAEALQYAHERGVVHRDVKPSNVILEVDGRPHLMDFGLARRDAGEVRMTIEGQVLGTPAYMSPEQARGEAHQVDGRADVYSLGVVLYELLTGEVPFRGNQRMLLLQVLRDDPRPPRLLNDRLPRDLETICLEAMAKEPGRRYATAGELAADLKRWLDGDPIKARPVGAVEQGWRWCRRHPAAAGLVAALLGLLIVGTTGAVLAVSAAQIADTRDALQVAKDNLEDANRKLTEANGREEQARRRTEELLVKLYVANGNNAMERGDALAALPWFVEALHAEPHPEEAELHRTRLTLTLRSCPRLRQLLQNPAGASATALSPDGKLLAGCVLEEVQVWDLTRETPTCITLSQGSPAGMATFSPDGHRLAVLCGDGTIHLWDVETHKQVLPPLKHGTLLSRAVFSRDGTLLMSSGGKNVLTWDTTTGRAAGPPLKHTGDVRTAVLEPAGRRVLSTTDNSLFLWDVDKGRLSFGPLKLETTVRQAAFSPDGLRFFALGQDKTIRAWKLDGQAAFPPWHVDDVTQGPIELVFNGDGKLLALTGTGGLIHVHDAVTGQPAGPLLNHGAELRALAFSHDGSMLATAGEDGLVRLWDWTDGRTSLPPLRHQYGLVQLAFLPDDTALFTLDQQSVVRIWDLTTAGPRSLPTPHGDKLHQVALSPNGRWLLVTDLAGTVRCWDLERGQVTLLAQLDADVVMPGCGSFSPDSRRLIVSTLNGKVLAWDVETHRECLPPLAHPDKVKYAEMSPDGERVLTVCADDKVRLWNVNGDTVGEPMTMKGAVSWAHFSSAGHRIAAGGTGPVVRVWELGSGLHTDLPHADKTKMGVFQPTGRLLITACDDGKLHRWDVVAGQELQPPLDVADCWDVAFSRDGRRVLTAAPKGGAIRCWDVLTGLPLGSGLPELAHEFSWAECPNGRLCVITGLDGSLQVWDAWTGQMVGLPLSSHSAASWVGVTPTGNRLVAVGNDGTVTLWDLPAVPQGIDELRSLAQMLSASRIDDSGAAVRLTPDLEAWRGLRRSWPEAFVAPPEHVNSWRQQRAEDCFQREQWAGAVLHLDWLLQDPDPGVELLRQRAEAQRRLGVFDRAAADFGRILERGKGHENARFSRACCRLGLGDADGALEDFDAVIRSHADKEMTSYLGRSLAHALKGDSKSADADFREVVNVGMFLEPPSDWWQQRPVSGDWFWGEMQGRWDTLRTATLRPADRLPAWLRRVRGVAFLSGSEYLEAAAEFAQATEERPNDSLSWYGRALAEALFHDWDRALASCDRLLEVDATNWRGWCVRGHAQREKHRYREALADFDKAVGCQRDAVAALAGRAQVNANLGRWDRAAADWDEVIQINAPLVQVFRERAEARARLGQLDKAVADCTAALRLENLDGVDRLGLHLARGRLYRRLGQLEKAVEDFDEVSKAPGLIDSNTAEALADEAACEMALVRSNQGRHDEAEKSLSVLSSSPYVAYQAAAALALLKLQSGDVSGYRKVCSEALAKEWQDVPAPEKLPQLIWVCCLKADTGKDWKAVQDRAQSWGDAPDDPDTRTTLAAVLLRAGERDKAKALLQTILEDSSDGQSTAIDRVLLALVHAQAGEREQAKKWLGSTISSDEQLKRLDWPERAGLTHLRQEAEQLLDQPKK